MVTSAQKKGQIRWINIAKLICILAVVSQHGGLPMQLPYPMYRATELAVPTFFLLAGITSYLSCDRNADKKISSEILRHLKAFLGPYCFASVCYNVLALRRFDLISALTATINFSGAAHFYFAFVYLQFILIGPFLYRVVRYYRERYVQQGVVFAALLFVAYLSIRYTSMLPIYGGGYYLLGGTYLPMFYLGMIVANRMALAKPRQKWQQWTHVGVSVLLWGVWLAVMCKDNYAMDKYLPFGAGINPPSISCFVFGLLTLYMFHSVGTMLEEIHTGPVNGLLNGLSWLGRCTMYIFLFHWYMLNTVCASLGLTSVWAIRIVYYFMMVCVPVALKVLVDLVKRWFKKVMSAEA